MFKAGSFHYGVCQNAGGGTRVPRVACPLLRCPSSLPGPVGGSSRSIHPTADYSARAHTSWLWVWPRRGEFLDAVWTCSGGVLTVPSRCRIECRQEKKDGLGSVQAPASVCRCWGWGGECAKMSRQLSRGAAGAKTLKWEKASCRLGTGKEGRQDNEVWLGRAQSLGSPTKSWV